VAREPDALTSSVQRALHDTPLSLLRLGRLAGVPQSTLSRIESGERRATLEVAASVAAALERIGGTCTAAARSIRRAARSTDGAAQ